MRLTEDTAALPERDDMAEMPIAQVRAATRHLAELQTSLLALGVRVFGGRIDRFIIYTLAARVAGLSDSDASAMVPTSAHALAASLGRPYETIRRHVNALIEDGLCVRSGNRIHVTVEGLRRPRIAHLLRWSHDCFVRFVEDLAAAGEALPPPRIGAPYEMANGVRTGVDIMLAVLQTNRERHANWLDLVLFSTVIAANCRGNRVGDAFSRADRPVSSRAVARMIGVTPVTAHRHLSAMALTGQLVRIRSGFRVNGAWLAHPAAQAVGDASLQNVRRLLGGLAVQGFPFDQPARAYLAARPPFTPIR
ncbi:hypothetical protein [Sphingomonas koreensis]|jgi:hypothetical protein|nr:hypothetical protein [Sphingomonas koreensis]MDC7812078.1 hypothetical protein [Sphingomonas koreensis]PJI89185.1 hypothetical protein BDW16_2493 [Sphingomonas koreensis]RSU30860.1 hypothetical protein CA222_02000 [Sphingomonas koreensis]RSU31955.1 hypothetical protein CA225_01080 [Sphingomonas koreensis]RSU39124.1 hypothetical protein BRX39_00450 [Sphingomonas koreensis]